MVSTTQPDEGYDLITLDETATFLCASPSQVSRWTAQGKLRAYRPGNRLMFSRADLRAFMEASANRKPVSA